MKFRIPISAPVLNGNEKRYVLDCLDSNLISSIGPYVERFENRFAEFCQTRHAIACSNGTVALHLALMAAGVQEGDEVLVPTLTFIATANAVTYCGAKPVFVDSDPETWNLSPADLERKITARTKAVIPVHLYGLPAEMKRINEIASRHGLAVIEDAAEAIGAEVDGRRVGSLGRLGTFSFYGNKILTTGEGGAVVTNDDSLAAKVRSLKGQGLDPKRRYWFSIIGYNYRMTNIAAALGLAQLEKVDWHCGRRREICAWYREALGGDPRFELQKQGPGLRHADWIFSVLLAGGDETIRDGLAHALAEDGIETRPVFYPLHTLPPYRPLGASCPNAESMGLRGLSLPTWGGLTRDEVSYVCERLRHHALRLAA